MIEDLLESGPQFSFHQAMRLLRYHIRATNADRAPTGRDAVLDPFERRVQIRPELSLGAPPSELAKLVEEPGPDGLTYQLTTRFLGLYGVSSPLPVYYTEDLIEEAREDESASREFLDFLNGPFYHLLFRVLSRFRYQFRIAEEDDELTLEILFSLLGVGSPEHRAKLENPRRLLRYLGLFSQYPRSGLGLRTLLCDALEEESVDLEPCIARTVPIPLDQRLNLGGKVGRLGEDTYLGEEIEDPLGGCRLRLGPLDKDRYHEFLPDGGRFEEMSTMTRLYLTEPLTVDVEIRLAAGEVEPASLGGERWSRLGWNTWVFADKHEEELAAGFQI